MKPERWNLYERGYTFLYIFLATRSLSPCICHRAVANASEGNIPGAVAQESVFRWESRESGGIWQGKAREGGIRGYLGILGSSPVARLSPTS